MCRGPVPLSRMCKNTRRLLMWRVSMQGGHICVKHNKKKRKRIRSSSAGWAKMESQWIVELTSSGRVDAVKKGPFPLIIYFPIRHCPARGKNTFISGTLFCEASNQEPVHSSIVSIVGRGGLTWRIDRPWLSLHVCVCTVCLIVSVENWQYFPFYVCCSSSVNMS